MMWGALDRLLWLPLAIPLAWLLFVLAARRRRALDRFVDPSVQPVLAPAWLPRRAAQRLGLRILALGLLGVALARPQWGYQWQEVRRRGLDILVVFDTSRSMTATDIKPTRLQQAQWGVRDLVRHLRGDRIGLVPFAGSSVVMCPLTTEYGAFLMTVDDLYAGIIPRGGTAIEQALRTAIAALPEDGAADRVILLITDGEDHEGDPLSLIPELQRRNIRVFTIGIGSLDGGLIPADDGGYFRDRQGQIVQTALREDALQRLALATGGTYVRSAPGDIGLERIFKESIDQLVRDEQDARSIRVYEDRFVGFILAALILLALESMLPLAQKPQRGQSRIIVLLGVLSLHAVPARAESPSARAAFDAGLRAFSASHFSAAMDDFLAAADAAPAEKLDPAAAHFNAGLAAYAAGDLEQAATHFARATTSADLGLQSKAFYNRGNALFHLADRPLQMLGDTLPPAPALESSESSIGEAIQMFENAIALDPNDVDAKANYELAVLKQQQIQQMQQQQQEPQEQPDSDQEQDDPSPPTPPESEEDEPPEPAPEPSPTDPQEAEAEPRPDEEESNGEMSREEAEMLLDALREQEQSDRDRLQPSLGRPVPVEKDW